MRQKFTAGTFLIGSLIAFCASTACAQGMGEGERAVAPQAPAQQGSVDSRDEEIGKKIKEIEQEMEGIKNEIAHVKEEINIITIRARESVLEHH